ncbi:hypothetical protein PanWU01x14_031850 [Parasponia andersonii]|uniref:Uncharacterized protein n=1 Tax=Parasponia andersonii TaxID=3476 RepID=A0A2P5DUA5_PARAD|nr:hypothetical protein PanWU01x14_031850 [Parasponia andersonii]
MNFKTQNRDDVAPAEVNNIDELLRESRVVTQDYFLVDDDEFEDDTLEEYNDEKIKIVDNDTSSEENNNKFDNEVVHLLVLGRVVIDLTPKERVREETRGIAIEKEIRRAKVTKLKVQHDKQTGKLVLKHGKIFLNLLAKLVRDTIPASTLAWKDVKKEDLDLIFERLDRKFDYPWDNVIFMDSIEQSIMHYLRDWRNNMKVHFITVGGKEALAAAKAKPYKNILEDH